MNMKNQRCFLTVLSTFVVSAVVSVESQSLQKLNQAPKQIDGPQVLNNTHMVQSQNRFGESFGGESDQFGLSIANTGMGDGIRAFTGSSLEKRAAILGVAKNTKGIVFGVYGITESYSNKSAGVFGLGNALTGLSMGVIGETVSNMDGTVGVLGRASAASGATAGVLGITNSISNEASGIRGIAKRLDGATFGVYGETNSQSGGAVGIYGLAKHPQGLTRGVVGKTESNTDGTAGVLGLAAAANGRSYGVSGETKSSKDFASGVHGLASASLGRTFGVYGESKSPMNNSAGVAGIASATDGQTFGVYGETHSGRWDAAAGKFVAMDKDGSGIALWAETKSDSGYAIYTKGDVRVNGDLRVAGKLLGEIKRESRKSYVSLSPAAFRPGQEYDSFGKSGKSWDGSMWETVIRQAHYWVNSGAQLISSSGVEVVDFVADVQLPHGAIVKKLTCLWATPLRRHAKLKFYQVLRGKRHEDKDIRAEFVSNRITNSVYEESTSLNFSIDNLTYNYYMRLELPGSFEFNGVLIEYEVSEL